MGQLNNVLAKSACALWPYTDIQTHIHKHIPVYTHHGNSMPGNGFFFFFLAALGLCCCVWAFSSCGEQGLLYVAVHGLLVAVASLAAEHRL